MATFFQRRNKRRRQSLLSSGFFLLCLTSLAGLVFSEPPSAKPLEVYETIPDTKALLSSPQFIVIDDFNSGKFKNNRGAPWRTKAPGGGIDINLDKRDGRNPSRGYSLMASFNLEENEKAYLKSFLNLLDVSQAEYLVFKYLIDNKAREQFQGKMVVALEDWKHRKSSYVLPKIKVTEHSKWEQAIIPLEALGDIDFNRLLAIQFLIRADEVPIKGTLWLDEIAFFGFNDVAFESHRDDLVGFPKTKLNSRGKEAIVSANIAKNKLRLIAEDTRQYFVNAKDRNTSLVVDHIAVGDTPLAADYTSITNIAMDLMGQVVSMEMGLISREEAKEEVVKIMTTLERMRRYKGFFYNFYNTKTLSVTRQYISSVDSGWLAIALVVLRQTFEGEIAEVATQFLEGFDFEYFLDPENNQFVIGFDVPEKDFGGYHYGMLISEARATSLLAIGKGDVSREHWWFLYRTPPGAWDWQNQVPQGDYQTYEGIDVFQGHYVSEKGAFLPSWGGSLFEYLMPTLVIDEAKLSKNSFGRNNRVAAEIQRDYALHEKNYPVWGISPAAAINGRRWQYGEFGVKKLSVKGYPDRKVITPHASILALEILPEDVLKNIESLLDLGLYGEYGFYDSINLRTGRVSPQYLALDQGMILASIGNYLTKGVLRERFHADPIGKNIENLLTQEQFFSE